jgi:hypothetical protein
MLLASHHSATKSHLHDITRCIHPFFCPGRPLPVVRTATFAAPSGAEEELPGQSRFPAHEEPQGPARPKAMPNSGPAIRYQDAIG